MTGTRLYTLEEVRDAVGIGKDIAIECTFFTRETVERDTRILNDMRKYPEVFQDDIQRYERRIGTGEVPETLKRELGIIR